MPIIPFSIPISLAIQGVYLNNNDHDDEKNFIHNISKNKHIKK